MDRSPKETFYNRSLERALQILCIFRFDNQALTLTQLSELSGLHKATVLRLCSTLIKYDFLRYHQDSKHYSLGDNVHDIVDKFNAQDIVDKRSLTIE
jgi:DNA-binding IclR family transcriptional regulator